MLHEFAIEPEALANKGACRYFLDQLGVEHGRLVAELPKRNKWLRAAYEAAKNEAKGEIELKYIEERLRQALTHKFMVRADRHPYDGTRSWLENAEACETLRAIISRVNPNGHAKVLIAHEIDETTALWRVPRQVSIPRDALGLATVCAPLFSLSEELILVDPNFEPTGERWRAGLHALLAAFARHSPNRAKLPPADRRIELHVEAKGPDEGWAERTQELTGFIPAGWRLRLYRWRQNDHGEKPHARFVLTEIGGLHVDYGLDAPGYGTTHVGLIDDSFARTSRADYHKDTARYELVQEALTIGTLTE
jgi:hypothetical protein